MGQLQIVVGGQFGSEAKGHVTSYLAQKGRDNKDAVAVARVGGPNAGHTAIDHKGKKWALRQVPVGILTSGAVPVIAAGSEIDPEVLATEVADLDAAGYRASHRLLIDYSATVLEPRHKRGEETAGLVGRIGSTGKGIGAARASRIMRTATTARDFLSLGTLGTVVNTSKYLQTFCRVGGTVIIEGTQGYGLGLNTRFYPQTTSGNCRAIDFLSQTGLSPWALNLEGNSPEVWVVIRPYPIRVAGNSGPLKHETSWDELNLKPEKTTVTQKIRRVGGWDGDLVREAVSANGRNGVRIALMMADQVESDLAGVDDIKQYRKLSVGARNRVDRLVRRVEHDTAARVALLGTGPDTRFEWEGNHDDA